MKTETTRPLTDDDLHALLDGELTPPAAQDIRRSVAQDPSLRARLDGFAMEHAVLKRLHRDVLQQPLPDHLVRTARKLQGRHVQARRWGLGAAMAASLVMAFGLGWTLRPWVLADRSGNGVAARSGYEGVSSARPEFVSQAASAYAVYSPEVKHPVEVTADQQEHLVQWLSKRLGRPLKLPHLDGLGYELVGGRLLPGNDGARALFMYQAKDGQRITLYLGSRPDAIQASSVEFKFSQEGSVPSFYWVDQGYSYALSGRVGRADLLNLAEAVYHQIN